MPRLICQFLYVECHVLAIASLQSCQFICLSQYQLLHAVCQISHASYSIPAFTCRHMSAKSSLWVVKLAYTSNCYISVYMPSALFQELYAECYMLYAKLHMLDCNMPNAMTIAMSFSMTTEQVGHLIIYIYIYYPAMTLHIAVTEKSLLLYHYGFNFYLRSHVFQFVSISRYQVLSWVTCISVCRHIMASIKISNHRLFRFASLSRHQSVAHIAVYFGMPTYHGIV
jgi:hypothetical protein